eukprot:scaffold153058_cov47-Prasinocladus_malaysianus.AAC.1
MAPEVVAKAAKARRTSTLAMASAMASQAPICSRKDAAMTLVASTSRANTISSSDSPSQASSPSPTSSTAAWLSLSPKMLDDNNNTNRIEFQICGDHQYHNGRICDQNLTAAL